MKFDPRNSLPLLGQFKKIVGTLPQKKTGKLSKKQHDALTQLSYYANLGFPPAITYLGVLYENGYYFKKNELYAFQLYKKAAECKYPEGYYRLGAYLIENDYDLRNVGLRFCVKAYLMGYINAGITMANAIQRASLSSPYHEAIFTKTLETIWRTYNRIDAKIELALFYLQKGDYKNLTNYRDKGKKYFIELIANDKNINAALALLEYVSHDFFTYSDEERTALVKFIEKSIPSIINDSKYRSLKKNAFQ